MTLNLSEKQLKVLERLRQFARERGYMPSLRELAQELGITYATVRQHLDALKRKGFLASDGQAHGLSLLREKLGSEAGVEVPVIGTIAAGRPIEALEAVERPIVVSAQMARGEAYALRVRGDSMVDDHILDGDYVIVEPASTVDDGAIAVALLEDGTATLKRVYREKGRIRLQPANPAMSPLYVKKLRIQGRVRGVLRCT
ncbi:MAG: repressor LexA [Candidatus Wallbacteria bacterium]|nr:repressor LexA [Candidatus Wallbacteria bacterium]